MLQIINNLDARIAEVLSQDPVRPHIPHELRIGKNRETYILTIDNDIRAVCCTSYISKVPAVETDLFDECFDNTIAVFYTIWSYSSGSGRDLLLKLLSYIREQKSYVKRFVTLSPKTEMAKRFHLGNGAVFLRENVDTINYEYHANTI